MGVSLELLTPSHRYLVQCLHCSLAHLVAVFADVTNIMSLFAEVHVFEYMYFSSFVYTLSILYILPWESLLANLDKTTCGRVAQLGNLA